MNPFPHVVLHHGFLGAMKKVGGVGWSSFSGIDRAISRAGYPVTVSTVHPTGGIERRARELKACILQNCDPPAGEKIILLAHSMGGLDARFMLSRLGMADKVAALITVCTPHRGTPYADWLVQHLGRRLRGIQLVNFLGLDLAGLMDLTTTSCATFNREIIDMPGVRYFSVGGNRPPRMMPPFRYQGWKIIHRIEGENDGLVSLSSSIWGESLGTWATDHWNAVNRRFVPRGKGAIGDIASYYVAMLQRVIAMQEREPELSAMSG